jgi:predicted KAP-like P-loop ATPase
LNNESQFPAEFLPEKPINSFDDKKDLFGYKKIAKEIALSILRLQSDSGYVLAINGKWGAGKSSFLYYIKQYLTDHYNDLSIPLSSKKVITLKFDPWLFSGHQDIINQFFIQLQSSLIQKKKLSSKTLKVLNDFFRYGSELRKVATLESQVAGWAFTGLNTITQVKIRSSVRSISELKDEIKKELPNLDDKIVIIIDDIDRLIPEEICELFRAIKAIGDFPNIVYLLAYDQDIVSLALECEHTHQYQDINSRGYYGIKYLEKIVQFTVNIPDIKETQFKMFLDEILFNRIFKDSLQYLIEPNRWNMQYQCGVKFIVNTPRSAIRLYNALQLLYPSVKNEVNPVDFILLEVIREHYSWLYDLIHKNPHCFFQKHPNTFMLFEGNESENRIRDFHKKWRSKILDDLQLQAVTNIIKELFPEAENFILDRDNYFRNSVRNSIVCNIGLNYETFQKYFRYQVESENFSNTELYQSICTINNPMEFINLISQLKLISGREEYSPDYILTRIFPYISLNIQQSTLTNIILGLFQFPYEFLQKSLKITYDNKQSNEEIKEIISLILFETTKNIHGNLYEILKTGIPNGSNLAIIALFIEDVYKQIQQLKLQTEKNRFMHKCILKPEELDDLAELFIKKVQKVLPEDPLFFSLPNIPQIINICCRSEEGSDFLKTEIDKLWDNDETIIQVIINSKQFQYFNPITLSSLHHFKTVQEFKDKINFIIDNYNVKINEKEILGEFLQVQ